MSWLLSIERRAVFVERQVLYRVRRGVGIHHRRSLGQAIPGAVLKIRWHSQLGRTLPTGDEDALASWQHPNLVRTKQWNAERACLVVDAAEGGVVFGVLSQHLLDVSSGLQVEPGEEELIGAATREDRPGFSAAIDGLELGEGLEDDADRAAPLAECRDGRGEVLDVAHVPELIQEEEDGQKVFAQVSKAVGEAGRVEQVQDDAEVPHLVLRHDQEDRRVLMPERLQFDGVAGRETAHLRIGPEFERRPRTGDDRRHDLRVGGAESQILREHAWVVVLEVAAHEAVHA